MIELTKDNFDVEVLQAQGLVFVDFWSIKCESCMGILPDVEALAEKYAGRAKFCKLDIAGNKRLAIAQKIMGIPAFAFYRDGGKAFVFDKEAIEEGGIAAVESKLNELLGDH